MGTIPGGPRAISFHCIETTKGPGCRVTLHSAGAKLGDLRRSCALNGVARDVGMVQGASRTRRSSRKEGLPPIRVTGPMDMNEALARFASASGIRFEYVGETTVTPYQTTDWVWAVQTTSGRSSSRFTTRFGCRYSQGPSRDSEELSGCRKETLHPCTPRPPSRSTTRQPQSRGSDPSRVGR